MKPLDPENPLSRTTLHIRLSDQQYNDLKELAWRNRKNVSQYIRDLVAEQLDKCTAPPKRKGR